VLSLKKRRDDLVVIRYIIIIIIWHSRVTSLLTYFGLSTHVSLIPLQGRVTCQDDLEVNAV